MGKTDEEDFEIVRALKDLKASALPMFAGSPVPSFTSKRTTVKVTLNPKDSETKEADFYLTIGIGSKQSKMDKPRVFLVKESKEAEIGKICSEYAPNNKEDCRREIESEIESFEPEVEQLCQERKETEKEKYQQQQQSNQQSQQQQQKIRQQHQQQQQQQQQKMDEEDFEIVRALKDLKASALSMSAGSPVPSFTSKRTTAKVTLNPKDSETKEADFYLTIGIGSKQSKMDKPRVFLVKGSKEAE